VLGNTLALIAGEKAGIIKQNIPVVSSPQKDEALDVLLRVAKLNNSEFTLIGRDVKFELIESSLSGQMLHVENLKLQIPLLGNHQLENAATAYTALKKSGIKISDEQIQTGFANVRWRARFEIARLNPTLIFDSAHNHDSFLRLDETLQEYFPNQKVYLIFGASEDKNILDMFSALKSRLNKIIVTKADHPRALDVEKIVRLADQLEIKSEAVFPVRDALKRALELSSKDGSIVLSAGSMFVTAEVMREWNALTPNPSPIGRGAKGRGI
jgi:dihydrofolate synthase/folylpolyglutamate synthase